MRFVTLVIDCYCIFSFKVSECVSVFNVHTVKERFDDHQHKMYGSCKQFINMWKSGPADVIAVFVFKIHQDFFYYLIRGTRWGEIAALWAVKECFCGRSQQLMSSSFFPWLQFGRSAFCEGCSTLCTTAASSSTISAVCSYLGCRPHESAIYFETKVVTAEVWREWWALPLVLLQAQPLSLLYRFTFQIPKIEFTAFEMWVPNTDKVK